MKGILFKPDMIQAIIEGRKTQTRRVIKPQPHSLCWADGMADSIRGVKIIGDTGYYDYSLGFPKRVKPRYQVGETVYIKEAWATYRANDDLTISQLPETATIFYTGEIGEYEYIGKCRSPMMMREIFACYFIVITDVRAERLQEISYGNVKAEGIIAVNDGSLRGAIDIAERAFKDFKELWNSINKDYPWESNPWVWVYIFEWYRSVLGHDII